MEKKYRTTKRGSNRGNISLDNNNNIFNNNYKINIKIYLKFWVCKNFIKIFTHSLKSSRSKFK